MSSQDRNNNKDTASVVEEASNFFTKWLKPQGDGEGWDEVCLQWCKQTSAARKENADPDCTMLCFKRPTSHQADNKTTWNPLEGYAVSVVEGKKNCVDHTNGMITTENITDKESLAVKDDGLTRHEFDLGNVWKDTDNKAKQLVNEHVIPLFNSTIEQALSLKDSPEAAQFQSYAKSLLDQVYPIKPFDTEEKSNDKKK